MCDGRGDGAHSESPGSDSRPQLQLRVQLVSTFYEVCQCVCVCVASVGQRLDCRMGTASMKRVLVWMEFCHAKLRDALMRNWVTPRSEIDL